MNGHTCSIGIIISKAPRGSPKGKGKREKGKQKEEKSCKVASEIILKRRPLTAANRR
jgi:hypothetical protein